MGLATDADGSAGGRGQLPLRGEQGQRLPPVHEGRHASLAQPCGPFPIAPCQRRAGRIVGRTEPGAFQHEPCQGKAGVAHHRLGGDAAAHGVADEHRGALGRGHQAHNSGHTVAHRPHRSEGIGDRMVGRIAGRAASRIAGRTVCDRMVDRIAGRTVGDVTSRVGGQITRWAAGSVVSRITRRRQLFPAVACTKGKAALRLKQVRGIGAPTLPLQNPGHPIPRCGSLGEPVQQDDRGLLRPPRDRLLPPAQSSCRSLPPLFRRRALLPSHRAAA